jgi:hypothetical protein
MDLHRMTRRIAQTTTTLLALVVLLVLPGSAAADDYVVRLGSTSGSHWSTYGAGPFLVSPGRVASGKGTFAAGNYRSWRAQVVGTGSRIVGGRVRIGVTTPNQFMRGRIVVGTGNVPVVVHEEFGTGAVERAIPSGPHDWVQFDISSTSAVTTGSPSEDRVDLQFVELVLRDGVPPALEPLALPAAGAWHGAGVCIPFSIRLTDQGGGLLRSQVRRASDGRVVTELGTTQVESPKPGPGEQHLSDCIQPGEHGHGDTAFVATAWDVSGVARELAFTVRADHRPPSIVGGPADGARITTPTPAVTFEVTDEGTGLAGVSATLDGSAVPVTMSAGVATVQVGTLARGQHVVALAAADGAGNTTRVERRVTVADDTPPALVVTSPGARGEATTSLIVRASDDHSGVDPASWTLAVDGAATAFRADAAQLTASLGPLAPGSHRIDVVVQDVAGNRATTTHAYYVVPPPPPPGAEPGAAAAAPPGRSGAFLVDAPRTPVAHGRRATVTVHVARDGGSVPGQLVTVRRDGVQLATGITDDDGVARVTFTAMRPGRYDALADGMGFEPVELGVRVAPRIVITTSTARPLVGERVRLGGRIFPALRGRRVIVEARVGGVWFPVRQASASTVTGRFSSAVVSAAPGPIRVRVRLKPTGAWAATVSNERLLQVTRSPADR